MVSVSMIHPITNFKVLQEQSLFCSSLRENGSRKKKLTIRDIEWPQNVVNGMQEYLPHVASPRSPLS